MFDLVQVLCVAVRTLKEVPTRRQVNFSRVCNGSPLACGVHRGELGKYLRRRAIFEPNDTREKFKLWQHTKADRDTEVLIIIAIHGFRPSILISTQQRHVPYRNLNPWKLGESVRYISSRNVPSRRRSVETIRLGFGGEGSLM